MTIYAVANDNGTLTPPFIIDGIGNGGVFPITYVVECDLHQQYWRQHYFNSSLSSRYYNQRFPFASEIRMWSDRIFIQRKAVT